jgi:hypothetical protein
MDAQHKFHHYFYNPSPFAVIADEYIDQFIRSTPMVVSTHARTHARTHAPLHRYQRALLGGESALTSGSPLQEPSYNAVQHRTPQMCSCCR